ncbi:betaine--homocysteine S-methyltransferase 1-like [Saccostrea echinata]|uniref:betaine--homocysteine S-methyltransferase 1-like n=1 Tax=Saccostrea echinata TaxID=191078 RepID=UPI002A836DC9|nr:betaine--homocysteine S-methyltransferase 1-like [Saccostrea echinata]
MAKQGLVERLKNGEKILIAEGYMWELERRGYLTAGGFIPEVVLDNPEIVRALHQEFVHAGTDVIEAFTYYGHREKLRLIGREDDLEKLNREALQIAKEVASDNGKLLAGGICNTGVYNPEDEATFATVTSMFKEQIEWAVEYGVDFIIGETFNDLGEAMLALKAIQNYGKGVPAVITLTAYFPDTTTDDVPIPEACRRLEEAGAAVVGLNCGRGPSTMIPLVKEIKKVCKGPVAMLPVTFRCRDNCRTFQSLKDPETGKPLYPFELEAARCSRSDIRSWAEEAKEAGVEYVGLCCGNASFYFRELAEAYGRKPPTSKYAPNLNLSHIFGKPSKDDRFKRSTKIREFMIGKENA